MKRDDLEKYLNNLLETEKFKDLGPNGLQVEGSAEITKIVCGVSACVELFESAAEKKAQAILVHHGIIWNFERPLYKGGYKQRVKLLMDNEINLLAYHLPLDAHSLFGNNALIAQKLGLQNTEPFGEYNGIAIGIKGNFGDKKSSDLFEAVKLNINPSAQIFPFGRSKISSVGIISGGAQKEIKQAVLQGLDAYITGEVSEHIYHYAKEEGIHFIAAGHHATEVFGVKALAAHISKKFGIEAEFVDIHNPV